MKMLSIILLILSGMAQGQEAQALFGPIIARIEVHNGTAWDVIEQIRSGIPNDAPTGISVEIPEDDLRKIRVSLLDLRSVPLGLALHYLYRSTMVIRPSYQGGLWILRHDKADLLISDMTLQVYEVSEEILKLLGLEFQEGTGLVDSDQNPWPTEQDFSASFLPTSKQLILQANAGFHEEINALILLTKRGYVELGIKNKGHQ